MGQNTKEADTMQYYDFVIKLAGSVYAKNAKEANKKINAHIYDLGDVDSLKYDICWPDVSWDMEG